MKNRIWHKTGSTTFILNLFRYGEHLTEWSRTFQVSDAWQVMKIMLDKEIQANSHQLVDIRKMLENLYEIHFSAPRISRWLSITVSLLQ
jgi:hypothetical protein